MAISAACGFAIFLAACAAVDLAIGPTGDEEFHHRSRHDRGREDWPRHDAHSSDQSSIVEDSLDDGPGPSRDDTGDIASSWKCGNTWHGTSEPGRADPGELPGSSLSCSQTSGDPFSDPFNHGI